MALKRFMITLPASTTLLAFLALQPTVSFVPLVALLSAMLIYTRLIISPYTTPRIEDVVFLSGSVTCGIFLARLAPTLNALSTPATSTAMLLAGSFISTFVSLIPIALYVRFQSLVRREARSLGFAAFWTTASVLWARGSPIGRLGTWSAAAGGGAYEWILPYVGPSGMDWTVAMMGWVGAEVVLSMVGVAYEEPSQLVAVKPLIDLSEEEGESSSRLIEVDEAATPLSESTLRASPSPSRARVSDPLHLSTLYPILVLLILALPSVILPPPLPIAPRYPFGTDTTTPVSLACVLPPVSNPSSSQPSQPRALDSYIDESRRIGGSASIHLWPESAVQFEDGRAREEGFERIRKEISDTYGVWVGVGFEDDVLVNVEDGTGEARRKVRRNGLAVIGRDGLEMEYYKRNPVPVAESFSIPANRTQPPLHSLPIPYGLPSRRHHRPTHDVVISSSICLDLAHPFFPSLPPSPEPTLPADTHPSIILAPASTWHPTISLAMLSQARMRVLESGSTLLWCDKGGLHHGGEAISAIIGPRGETVTMRTGRGGSLVGEVGVPFMHGEDSERITVYTRVGDSMVLLGMWGLVGLVWVGAVGWLKIREYTPGGFGGFDIHERLRGVGRIMGEGGHRIRAMITGGGRRVRGLLRGGSKEERRPLRDEVPALIDV